MSDGSGGTQPPGWYEEAETGRQRWWDGTAWGQYADATAPPQSSFCTNCGKSVAPRAIVCTSCGFDPRSARNFCDNCGTATQPGQAVCLSCGTAIGSAAGAAGAGGSTSPKDKTVAGILAIILGCLGVHKFYLGRTTAGIVMLACSAVGFCCGIFIVIPYLLWFAMIVIGVVEGIIYLTKSDFEFQAKYVQQGKDWF